jgi:kynurenine formamidase
MLPDAERGVTHVENLCNLDKLIGKRFTVIGLPPKIRKETGSPRAYLDQHPGNLSDNVRSALI